MSIDSTIIKRLWNKLWNKDTEYYLPNIMTKGFSKWGITIPAYEGKNLDKIPAISLGNQDTYGEILIGFNNDSLSGLGGIQPTNFNYDDTNKEVTIGLGIPNLKFSGTYSVVATGLVGCAIGTAAGLLDILGSKAYVSIPDESDKFIVSSDIKTLEDNAPNANSLPFNPEYDKPINLENCTNTANSYQKILKTSTAGNTLDDIYTKNNEILNKILNANSYFKYVWQYYKTPTYGAPTKLKSTSYFANQTHDAAQPNSTQVVNDLDYHSHSIYTQTVLIEVAQEMKKNAESSGDKTTAEQCAKLLNDMDQFYKSIIHAGYGGQAKTVTVGAVMEIIKNAPANEYMFNDSSTMNESTLSPETLSARTKAHQDMKEWVDKHGNLILSEAHDRYFIEPTLSNTELTGNFDDNFGRTNIELKGKLAINNDYTKLTLDQLSINLSLEAINIDLYSEDHSPLFNLVQNLIAQSNPVKSSVKSHIIEGINSQNDNVEKAVNEALSKL